MLPLARAIYAALSGIGLLAAAKTGTTESIGQYGYAIAVGTFGVLLLGLGQDRVITKLAALQEPLPSAWRTTRIIQTAAILLGAAVLLFLGPKIAAATAAFVIIRILCTDFEAVIIANRRYGLIVISQTLNGMVTGVGLAWGAAHGPVVMLLATTAGNLVSIILYMTTLHSVAVHSEHSAMCIREGVSYTMLGIVATAYQRSDYTALAVTRQDIQDVASFSLGIRLFDVLTLLRSGLSQQWTVHLVKLSSVDMRRNFSRQASVQVCTLATCLGITLVLLIRPFVQLVGLSDYPNLTLMLIIIAIGTPLIASHSITSAAIFAVPAKAKVVRISFYLAAGSMLLTILLVFMWGAPGAVAATVLLEYISMVCFWPHVAAFLGAKRFELKQVIIWPLASLLILAIDALGTDFLKVPVGCACIAYGLVILKRLEAVSV